MPVSKDVDRFFDENEIVPTTLIEDNKEESRFKVKENVEFLSSPIDVEPSFEVNEASIYARSMDDFVSDTFAPVKIFVRKEALMRKVVVSASENKEEFPYQIKLNHAIFDTLDKMNEVDARKFEAYAIEKGYLMNDEIAYYQNTIWNTL
jgi:hypothetical protein